MFFWKTIKLYIIDLLTLNLFLIIIFINKIFIIIRIFLFLYKLKKFLNFLFIILFIKLQI